MKCKKSLTKIATIASLLSLILIFNISASAALPDLVNSTGSVATDPTKGEDITQGAQTEYYADQIVSTSTWADASAVTAFVTKAGFVKVSLPKTIILGVVITDPVLNTATASGEFRVGGLGDIAGTQMLKATMPASLTFASVGKTVNATVNTPVSTWNWGDLNPSTYNYKTIKIDIANLPSGVYKVNFVIDMSLVNDPV